MPQEAGGIRAQLPQLVLNSSQRGSIRTVAGPPRVDGESGFIPFLEGRERDRRPDCEVQKYPKRTG